MHQGPKVFSEAKLGNTTMGLRKETFVNITTRLNLHPSYMRAISQDIGLYRAFDINAECTGKSNQVTDFHPIRLKFVRIRCETAIWNGGVC